MQQLNCEDIADKFTLTVEKVSQYRSAHLKNAFFSNLKKTISERQFTILCVLAFSEKNTVSELSQMMKISKSTLSIIMSKMVKKGYLTKTHPNDNDDKRKIYFSISSSGKEILDSAKKAHLEDTKYIFSTMTEQQRNYLKLGFEKLANTVDETDKELIKVLNFIHNDDELSKSIFRQKLFMLAFIQKTSHLIEAEFKTKDKKSDLTKNQWNILMCIENHKLNTISKLENYLNSSGSTVSITVSKLVKNGYVFKEYPVGDEDGRVVYLRLTEKGKKNLIEIQQKCKKIFLNYVSTLDDKNKALVNEGLDLLLSAFNA